MGRSSMLKMPNQPSPTGAVQQIDDPTRKVFQARVRPIELSEANRAGLVDGTRAEGDDAPAADERFWFTAEISSTALDAYYTHMADSTLRNFARDAATGVSLLDSHNFSGLKLGVGYSAGGRYEEESEVGRALALFYIVPGIRFGGTHSFAGTDDYIRAIQNKVVRDVSVGFYGGRWVCDLCHQPYYGRDTTCLHVAGWEYEIDEDGQMSRRVCTVTVHEAGLSEVSLVYDGATPGAMILKVEQEAAAGRMSPAMIRQFEREYRIKLPKTMSFQVSPLPQLSQRDVVVVDGDEGEETMSKQSNTAAAVEQPAVSDKEEVEVSAAAAAELTEGERVLEETRRAMADSPAPRDLAPAAAVRWLSQQVAQLTQERDTAQQQIAQLQPLADQGRAYREDLVNQAVAEGVRAMGEAFPEETYRAMLAGAPLDHIRAVRDTFAAQAAVRFPGGRQTVDSPAADPQPVGSTTPSAAFRTQ